MGTDQPCKPLTLIGRKGNLRRFWTRHSGLRYGIEKGYATVELPISVGPTDFTRLKLGELNETCKLIVRIGRRWMDSLEVDRAAKEPEVNRIGECENGASGLPQPRFVKVPPGAPNM